MQNKERLYRINRALREGLINQEDAERCHHIRQIRNAATHYWDLSLETKDVLTSLRALHEVDHSELLVFHEDLEFLLQQVYSAFLWDAYYETVNVQTVTL